MNDDGLDEGDETSNEGRQMSVIRKIDWLDLSKR